MVKEVKLFLPRDTKAQEMLEAFKAELSAMPKNQRPKLVVKLLNLKDPAKFQEWLQSLEELFGGVYVAEFKKYGISAVPAVVVDGEKSVEGRYLTREEARLILQGFSPDLAQLKPAGAPPLELAPVEVEEEKPLQPPPTTRGQVIQQPPAQQVEEALPPVELAPVEIEEKPPQLPVPQAKPAEKPLQQPKPAPQPAVREPEPQRAPPQPALQPPKAPIQPPTQPPVQAQEQAGTCFTCLFYDKARNRCRLLHIQVPDPQNPPCGRRRAR